MNVYAFAPVKKAKRYHYYDTTITSLRGTKVIIYKCGRHSPIATKVIGWSKLPARLRAQGQLCPECKTRTPRRGTENE